MLIPTDIGALASRKSSELIERSPTDAWAACVTIWSRLFILAGPGLKRWPALFEHLRNAFWLAMERSIDIDVPPSAESLLAAFEEFDIEDDGSAEWNYAIDLIEVITPVLSGRPLGTCLDTVLRVYLEGTFNHLTRVYAIERGRPVSYAEVKTLLADDAEWERAVEFASAL